MERTYQVTMGVGDTYRFVSEAESWAELGQRCTAPELIRRLFGEKEGTRVADQVRECLLSGRTEISPARLDLSLRADEEQGAALASVTLFRARPGQQPALEELLRKVGQGPRDVW